MIWLLRGHASYASLLMRKVKWVSSRVERLQLQPRGVQLFHVSAEGRSLSALEDIGSVAHAVTKIGQTHSSGNGSSCKSDFAHTLEGSVGVTNG
jgi:hypothetical protein